MDDALKSRTKDGEVAAAGSAASSSLVGRQAGTRARGRLHCSSRTQQSLPEIACATMVPLTV